MVFLVIDPVVQQSVAGFNKVHQSVTSGHPDAASAVLNDVVYGIGRETVGCAERGYAVHVMIEHEESGTESSYPNAPALVNPK